MASKLHQLFVSETVNQFLGGGVREDFLQFSADLFELRLFQQLVELIAEPLGRASQMNLKHLADVHTRWHAERVEHHIHRGTVGEIRQVFLGQNIGDNAFVPVAAGHLIAHRQLAFHGHIDFDHFDHTRRQVVAFFKPADHLFEVVTHIFALAVVLLNDIVQLVGQGIVGHGKVFQLGHGYPLQGLSRNFGPLGQQNLLVLFQWRSNGFAGQYFGNHTPRDIADNRQLVGHILFINRNFGIFDLAGPIIFVGSPA